MGRCSPFPKTSARRKSADQIIVVNQGKIEATGTQTELLASCPLYQDMWEAHISVKDDGEVA